MRKPQHIRLAQSALEPLLLADRARLFSLRDDDLVVVWRGFDDSHAEACREALVLLFSGAGIDDPADLLVSITLPEGAATLLRLLDTPEPHPAPEHPPLQPLYAGLLARLEALLASADVARFARRRDICAPAQEGHFTLSWEQRYLSLTELAAAVAPEYDLRAEPWLFRRLTRTLAQRMLALLSAAGELDAAGPFAINLHVANILAPEFLRFDAALPRALRGKVVLGLAPPDILADPAGFAFARAFTQVRGYRIVLCDVTSDLIDVLAAAAEAVDLLELRWSPALGERVPPLIDPARLLLSGVDDANALAWGLGHGIGLFQGGEVARGLRINRPSRRAEWG